MSFTIERVLPCFEDGSVVVEAPGAGPGNWSGAPAAVLDDGTYWLAYRVRRPLTAGRGVSTVVARSPTASPSSRSPRCSRDAFGAASFERPALVPSPRRRLAALSLVRHARLQALVDRGPRRRPPEDLPSGRRTVVLPGSARSAVKDPVMVRDGRAGTCGCAATRWTVPGAEDRMTTRYLTSDDGLAWTDRGVARAAGSGWDARGTRVSTVLSLDPLVVLYDGRADAASNWFETHRPGRSDVASRWSPTGAHRWRSRRTGTAPCVTPAAMPLPDGSMRFYFEAARADGSHDLMTSVSRRRRRQRNRRHERLVAAGRGRRVAKEPALLSLRQSSNDWPVTCSSRSMSVPKSSTRRLRTVGSSAGRAVAPRDCISPVNGSLARRHTSGGNQAPSPHRVRITRRQHRRGRSRSDEGT